MKIEWQKTDKVIIEYQTVDFPPPYSYQFRAEIDPGKGLLDFKLQYTDRENLDTEDILEEGFSTNDDFSWKGDLPEIWLRAFAGLITDSEFQPEKNDSFAIRVSFESEGNTLSYVPENAKDWDAFFQELLQGLYELEGKILPLTIRLAEIKPGKERRITLHFEFLQRKAIASIYSKEKEKEEPIAWHESRDILKTLFIPDYLQENAREKEPKKPGFYIDPGEGVWYTWGEGAVKPTKGSGIFEELQKLISRYDR